MIFRKKQPALPVLSEAYTTCSELPLLNFIKIVTTGELKWLLQSGTREDLPEIWETIYSEYVEISQNTTQNEALENTVDIAYYENRLKTTHDIVDYLRKREVPELREVLAEMGYMFPGDLERVLTQSKGEEVKLAQAKQKYATAKEETGEQSGELEWRRKIAQISKYQGGGMINAALISVYDFVALEREFSDYIDMMKRQQKHDTASY